MQAMCIIGEDYCNTFPLRNTGYPIHCMLQMTKYEAYSLVFYETSKEILMQSMKHEHSFPAGARLWKGKRGSDEVFNSFSHMFCKMRPVNDIFTRTPIAPSTPTVPTNKRLSSRFK